MSDGKKYFQTTKRGELGELRDELNSTNREKQKEVCIFTDPVSQRFSIGREEGDCSYECRQRRECFVCGCDKLCPS